MRLRGCGTMPDASEHVPEDVPEPVRDYLEQSHPQVFDLVLWVRRAVLDAEPDLTERVYRGWDGLGYRHPDAGYVCAIYPRADEVQLLFEHGVRLDDPHGILEGTGTQTRFIPVRQPADRLRGIIGDYVR